MTNDVKRKVLETFSAKLRGNAAVTEKMVRELRELFEQGEKASAEDVISILSDPSEDSEEVDP